MGWLVGLSDVLKLGLINLFINQVAYLAVVNRSKKRPLYKTLNKQKSKSFGESLDERGSRCVKKKILVRDSSFH